MSADKSMSADKHTPAPWHAKGKHVRYHLPGFATSELLADCDTEANARLIAAAPELLDALQRALSRLKWYTAGQETCDVSSADELTMEQAEAAIAKAEGKVTP